MHLGRFVVAALLGGLLGVTTSLANHGYGFAPAHTSQVLDAAGTWVAVGLVPCFAARRWLRSALLSAATLEAAVVGYDLTDLRAGAYARLAGMDPSAPVVTDWSGFGGDLLGYSLVAALAAAGLALIAIVVQRGHALGLAAQLVVPAYVAWGSWTRVQDAYATSTTSSALIDTNRAVTAVALAVVVLIAARGLAVRLRRTTGLPEGPSGWIRRPRPGGRTGRPPSTGSP